MIIENQRLPKISEDLPKIAEVEIFLKTIYRGYVVLQSNGHQANPERNGQHIQPALGNNPIGFNPGIGMALYFPKIYRIFQLSTSDYTTI